MEIIMLLFSKSGQWYHQIELWTVSDSGETIHSVTIRPYF